MNIHLEHQQPPDRHRRFGRNILIAILASGIVFGVEVWAAVRTGSLALLSDAAHAFVDITGLSLAYAALVLASRPASPHATFGYGRAEVLAAAINGLLVIGIAVAIVWRAIDRLQRPLPDLDTDLVLVVAAVSLVANVLAAALLQRDAGASINTRGAFVNVVGDALASLGVLASGLLVRWTGDTIWDTLVSFFVAAIILYAAWGLLRGAVAILLERAPPHLAPQQIKRAVESLPEVVNVHDLHIWTLTPGQHSLSMHASIEQEATDRFLSVIQAIEELLAERFGLEHCTIQVEPAGADPTSDRFDPVRGTLGE